MLDELGVARVDGVLLDLGVSSHQLDTAERGFRFAADTAERTPLDMRMDPTSGAAASELLRTASEEELEDWLRRFGDVRGARRLARALVAARERAPLQTAADLARSVFLTPQGVAKVVADLEQRGLVTRAGRRQRGRRTPVQLTPDGHVALARAESTVAALDAETHRHLGDAAAGLAAGLDRLEAWVLASDSARRQ